MASLCQRRVQHVTLINPITLTLFERLAEIFHLQTDLYVVDAKTSGLRLIQLVPRVHGGVQRQAAIFDPTNCRLRQTGSDARQLGRVVFGHNDFSV